MARSRRDETPRADAPRAFPTAPLVTCASCGQQDVPVGRSTLQALPHRRPGPCCEGLNCGHDEVRGDKDGAVTTRSSRPLCEDRAGAPLATDYGAEVERWEAGVSAA